MTDVGVTVPLPPRVERWLDVSTRRAVTVLVAIGLVAVAALLVLVYGLDGGADGSSSALPLVNAGLNAGATVFLVQGWRMVRARRLVAHRNAMLAALACSTVFLVGYLVHHTLHGDSPFGADGPVAAVYYVLLASHVVLSTLGLPAILVTVWASVSGRFDLHTRVARITLPAWLYVSVTGVAVALMLRFLG